MSRWRERLLVDLGHSTLIDEGDPVAAARALCESAAHGLEVERASLWLLEDDGAAMRCIHLFDSGSGGHQPQPELLLHAEQYPRYFEALRRARNIVADDARQHPDTAEFAQGYLETFRIAALLDSPIRQHGRMVGIFCAEHRGEPRRWTRGERNFAASLADLYGRALTAAERREYRDRLQALNQSLESRVQERTEELQAALDRLDEARQALMERERFAALGELVAGIAHEINTPVGVIVTATSHARGLLAELQRAHEQAELTRSAFDGALAGLAESLAMAERNAERAAALVESFKRTSADRSHDARTRFELGAVIGDVLTTLQPLLRRRKVAAVFEPGPPLRCDSHPGAVGQVLTNLVVNACVHGYGNDAPPGAQVRVRTWAEGDWVALEVADDGIGMAEGVRVRAFDAFFTTARSRGGTGLGLGIVRSLVVRNLGGEVSLDSLPGAGTRVRVRFPRNAPA